MLLVRIPALVSLAALLAACGGDAPEPEDAQTAQAAAEAGDSPEAGGVAATPPRTVEDAVDGAWRGEQARARDAFRNPAATIEFFDIDPSGVIVEIWPGGGWYADILAPWIEANGGTYVAAWPPVDPQNERAAAFRDRFLERFGSPLYGEATLVPFGAETGALMKAEPADAILTFRNVHNWMGAGFAEKAFDDFYAALKPGGKLGVVEHRLPASRVQDPRAATGYVQQDYVISLAEEAGFELVASSEINANPADTADHPFGVWTLPPVSRTSDFGEPTDPDFDTAPYDAIGESDRMTLLFRKPDAGETAPAPETDGDETGEGGE
ncbi:MAG: class I SAM-dependent methyltransferase [Oceanicaulis sp.]